MNKKNYWIPIGIVVVSVLVMVCSTLLFRRVEKPMITEHEFPVKITYEYNNEVIEYEGKYVATYSSGDISGNEQIRFWNGSLVEFDNEIFNNEKGSLYIQDNIVSGYLMGDPLFENEYNETEKFAPSAIYYDEKGEEFEQEDIISSLGFKILSYEYPQPIENEFVFSHVSGVDSDMVIPFTIIGVIAIVATLLFVKKEVSEYTMTDKSSRIINIVIGVLGLPILAVVCTLLGINGDTDFSYQLIYCVPAITALTIALSISFRRKGNSMASVVVQFIGPILFTSLLFIDFLSMMFA